ncbi:DNA cytosine methyltransferase [Marivita cryptomonadis]
MLAEPGFHTRCFVEWEEYPRSVIIAAQRAGYLAPAPIWDDLTTFDARPLAGAIDTLLAGYPCQPFSAAGQRKGEDDERHLFPHVARVAEELGDGLNWIFLENVAGHVSLGGETVLRTLRQMGFTPAVGLFSAEEIGAPQERLRWFCVAYRASGGQRERGDAAQPGRGGHADGGDLDLANAEDHCGRIYTGPGKPGSRATDAGRSGIDALGHTSADADARGLDGGSDRGPAPEGEGQGPERQRLWDRAGSAGNGTLDRAAGARRDPAGQRAGSDSQGGERLSGAGCDQLADTGGAGSQGREQRAVCGARWGGQGRAIAERGGVSLFPPGPGDSAAWASVLRSAPDMAPAASARDLHTWMGARPGSGWPRVVGSGG